MRIQVTLETKDGGNPVEFQVGRMINAGFTGRDQAAAQHHIDELAAEGIPVPDEIPVLYPVICRTLLPGAEAIEVYSGKTCGEVEYVLLIEESGRILVGLGSDHTDRHLEETDIPRAKQICPNIMSAKVWDLAEVADHWDKLVFRLWQEVEGKKLLYQEGPLALLMAPGPIKELISSRSGGPHPGDVIFSGTIGNLTGGFVFGDKVMAELEDPVLGRRLELAYTVSRIDQ